MIAETGPIEGLSWNLSPTADPGAPAGIGARQFVPGKIPPGLAGRGMLFPVGTRILSTHYIKTLGLGVSVCLVIAHCLVSESCARLAAQPLPRLLRPWYRLAPARMEAVEAFRRGKAVMVQRRRVLGGRQESLSAAVLDRRLEMRLDNVLHAHPSVRQQAAGRLLLRPAGKISGSCLPRRSCHSLPISAMRRAYVRPRARRRPLGWWLSIIDGQRLTRPREAGSSSALPKATNEQAAAFYGQSRAGRRRQGIGRVCGQPVQNLARGTKASPARKSIWNLTA